MKRNRFETDHEMLIYTKILDHNGIPVVSLDISKPDFCELLAGVDVFIYKWGHDHHNTQIANTILPIIEASQNLRCFPDMSTCWHYDDKIRQYYLLSDHGFPAVDSWVFWSRASALEWLAGHNDFPLVFKLRSGAGSLSVRLVRSRRSAESITKRMFGRGVLQTGVGLRHLTSTLNHDPVKIFRYYAINFRDRYLLPEQRQFWLRHKNYVYFQKFLPGNDWDTRVTTAGNRAHAFRRFTRPGDFRASGSNRWDIDPSQIDMRMVEIALTISRTLKFQAMAYDFIYDERREPKIMEMSYLYGGAGYPDFMNGYWDENLAWREGRYWPQYFELCDLLGMHDLKMPAIDTSTSYKKAKII